MHRQGKALHRRVRGRPPQRETVAHTAESASASARLRYRFDLALSRGPSVVIAWLGLVTLLLLVVTALVLTAFSVTGVNGSDDDLAIGEAFWQALLRVVDAGTFAGDTGWPTRIIGLGITLAGIFIAGSLIGLIANAVDQQIEALRRGRSTVVEHHHTLILGWSPRVPAIVRELIVANESEKSSAVVIVANVEKIEMEETLRAEVGDTRNTRIVCRRGEPWLPSSLELANASRARSIVVVGEGGDAVTVKTLLAVRAITGDESSIPVIAAVGARATGTSLEALLGNRLTTLCSDDVVAELTAQACRQRGLSSVFRELLDFDGDELYFAAFDELVGSTYQEAQLAFERCAVIGRLQGGRVELNPPANTVLAPGDELIAIAGDDSEFLLSGRTDSYSVLPAEEPSGAARRRRVVIAGWSDLAPRVVAELDEFLEPDAEIELLVDPQRVDVETARAALTTANVRLELTELTAGPETLAAHAARTAFHEVIVLGYRDAIDPEEADALTLLTLLAFRQVRQHEPVGPVRIVAELLDQRHAPLAAASGADDFIVSDELTSLMLAQLSERAELKQVFDDLFDRSGCTIELRPALAYGAHRAASFGDIVATASSLGQSAVGFRRAATGAVVINPPKSSPPELVPGDEVLVLSAGI